MSLLMGNLSFDRSSVPFQCANLHTCVVLDKELHHFCVLFMEVAFTGRLGAKPRPGHCFYVLTGIDVTTLGNDRRNDGAVFELGQKTYNPRGGCGSCSMQSGAEMIMLYMVIEKFKSGSRDKVYERFTTRGRVLPDGLFYVNSWLEFQGNRCFQLMETDKEYLFDEWRKEWEDLVDFEIIPLEQKQENKT